MNPRSTSEAALTGKPKKNRTARVSFSDNIATAASEKSPLFQPPVYKPATTKMRVPSPPMSTSSSDASETRTIEVKHVRQTSMPTGTNAKGFFAPTASENQHGITRRAHSLSSLPSLQEITESDTEEQEISLRK